MKVGTECTLASDFRILVSNFGTPSPCPLPLWGRGFAQVLPLLARTVARRLAAGWLRFLRFPQFDLAAFGIQYPCEAAVGIAVVVALQRRDALGRQHRQQAIDIVDGEVDHEL